MRPVAQRFGEGAYASRTFSAITDLITVVQHEIDFYLCSFSSPCMHAPPPPACLPRLSLTADVEMVCVVALRYGGESALVPGCFFVTV